MSESARKLRGRTPFEEAGDGVYILFKASDMEALQHQLGDTWAVGAHTKLNNFDLTWARSFLKHGAKKDNKPFAVDLDDLAEEVSMKDVIGKLLDALYWSLHGKGYMDYWDSVLKEQAEAIEKAQRRAREEEEDDPSLQGPAATSSVSSEQPSGQA